MLKDVHETESICKSMIADKKIVSTVLFTKYPFQLKCLVVDGIEISGPLKGSTQKVAIRRSLVSTFTHRIYPTVGPTKKLSALL